MFNENQLRLLALTVIGRTFTIKDIIESDCDEEIKDKWKLSLQEHLDLLPIIQAQADLLAQEDK